jgi:hypothetical protein
MKIPFSRPTFNLSLCLGLLCSISLYALPSSTQVEKTDDDAKVTIKIFNKAIKDDSKAPCQISIDVKGEAVAFSEGDTFTVEVLEDDLVGDDVIWSTMETITAMDLAAQQVTRTYDCTGNMGSDDAFGDLDVYGKVKVIKSECGFLCMNDEPKTANITVQVLDDDGNEEDDMLAAAKNIDAQATDRISKDSDYFKFNIATPANVTIKLDFLAGGGDVSLNLIQMGNTLLSGVATPTGRQITSDQPLNAGDYHIQLTPAEMMNFNFYVLTVDQEAVDVDCSPGMIEDRACGNCGKDKRTCNNMGKWSAWSGCQNEGVCSAGDEDVKSCGGEGTQKRVCNEMCQWGPLSACVECENGQRENCYEGPAEKQGIGICKAGQRTCQNGVWGMCENDVWPDMLENCADGLDNDCDGMADTMDGDCVGGIGAPCMQNTECAMGLTCLTQGFQDGYCGRIDCAQCQAGESCINYQGQNYCLKACASLMDCRSGYLCVSNAENTANACTPACLSDMNCAVNYTCVNTQCVPNPNATNPTDPNGTNTMNQGGTTAPPITTPNVAKSESCDQSSKGNHFALISLFLFALLIRLQRKQML